MAAFDICDFSSGAPRLMLHKRYTMYQVIQEAAGAAELSWTDCEREDRGDGFFLLAPPRLQRPQSDHLSGPRDQHTAAPDQQGAAREAATAPAHGGPRRRAHSR
ncbi:hypothetical protein GCM10023088_08470 [Actinomadura verrucosospora]